MAKISEALGASIKSKVMGVVARKAEKAAPAENPNVFLKIIGKNFLSFHGMARDLNVSRQNVQKLVGLEGEKPARGADAFFMKEGEKETALEVQRQKEEDKAAEKAPTPVQPKKKKSFKEQMLDMFSPKNILQSLTKIFAIGAVISIVWDIFGETFKEWASNLWETIKTKFDEFVTDIKQWFKDTIEPMIDKVKAFFTDYIIEPVKNFFGKIADFFVGYFETWKNLITNPIETVKGLWDKFSALIDSAIQKAADFYVNLGTVTKAVVDAVMPTSIQKFLESKGKKEGKEKTPEEKAAEEKKKVEAEKKRVAETEAAAAAVSEFPSEEAPPPTEPPSVTPPDDPGRAKAAAASRKARLKKKAEPAPTPSAEPPPKAAPPAGPSPTAGKAPSPSDSKPVKVGSETGKKAMIRAMDEYKISDPTARAAIMAQVGHESGGFKVLSENLNYKPATLLKIFPKYFKTPDDAQQTASAGPEAIANRVYGGRMGNAPDEGFLYRGRGFVQLTGKANYTKFGYASNPDAVATPEAGADTAMKYMLGYKGDWGDIKKLTKFVNGGYIGLEDRAAHFQAYLNDPEITNVGAVSTATSGGAVSSASGEVASGQRQQAKPQTPIIVNAPTNNTTIVAQNKTSAAPPSKKSTAESLSGRLA